MAPTLFAGIAVSDLEAAVAWYARLLGGPPAFRPNDDEAVWEVGPERFVFLERKPSAAGHARHLLFQEDLDAALAAVAALGIEPADDETYASGVRKVTFRDPDGNEIGFGGGPA